MRTKILMMLLGLMWLPLNQSVFGQLAADDDEKEPLVPKVYDVSDLIAADYSPSYSSGAFPGTGMFQYSDQTDSMGGFGGGMGAMGGGGQGGGGGGGLFAIPQGMGAGQGGGQGSFGGGGMGGYFPKVRSSGEEFDLAAASLAFEDLLLSIVAPLSWEENGGETGATAQTYNGHLVINQTAAVHQQISDFLEMMRQANQNTKVIRIEWLAIDADEIAMNTLAAFDDKQLNQFIASTPAQSGSISTLNGRVGFTTAAEHRNIVISVTPVVGSGPTQDAGNRVGYQPKTVKPAIGWLVQLRPLIPTGDDPVGRVQVGASYTAADKTPDNVPPMIDRGNIDSFQIGGMVQSKANHWVLVGGMGADGNETEDGQAKFHIVIRWSEVSGQQAEGE